RAPGGSSATGGSSSSASASSASTGAARASRHRPTSTQPGGGDHRALLDLPEAAALEHLLAACAHCHGVIDGARSRGGRARVAPGHETRPVRPAPRDSRNKSPAVRTRLVRDRVPPGPATHVAPVRLEKILDLPQRVVGTPPALVVLEGLLNV